MRIQFAVLFALAAGQATAEENMTHSTGTVTMTPVMIAQTIRSRSYVFEPKDDITAPELAQAMKAIIPIMTQRNPFGRSYIELIDNLPDNVKRHFRAEPAG